MRSVLNSSLHLATNQSQWLFGFYHRGIQFTSSNQPFLPVVVLWIVNYSLRTMINLTRFWWTIQSNQKGFR